MTFYENVVEKISCSTAGEFISKLRISDERWLPPKERECLWLFRGHGNADWKLIPSAWRIAESGFPETFEQALKQKVLGNLVNPIRDAILTQRRGYVPDENNVEEFEKQASLNPFLKEILLQIIFEIEVVHSFSKFVDQLGFQVPREPVMRLGNPMEFDWKTVISETVEVLRHNKWQVKPNKLMWAYRNGALVVLAQHHGVPTALVDWTRQPLIAAYFAAEDVVDNSVKSDFLGVWAIHTNVVGGYNRRLQSPSVMRSDIGYLHAQHGVLLYDLGADFYFIKHGKWPSIDQAVSETEYQLEHKPLRLVTLPSSEAEEVLRLLWAEGISRAHLMPSLDSISDTLKRYWMRL